MGLKWCDRRLMISPYCFALCLSEKDFWLELKKLNVPRTDWPAFSGNGHASTTVHFFEADGAGVPFAIVCMNTNPKATGMQVATVLVHEAVHIWQRVRRNIGAVGADEPGDEFEAYAIQNIAQELMLAYHATR